jgi:2-oxoglutarate dehydrogenase complex dehydrogenase (E1) component-like enzyme
VETPEPFKYTKEEKEMILDRLVWSDSFERFVSTKYPSEKRFGLEGGESLIPGMKAMVRIVSGEEGGGSKVATNRLTNCSPNTFLS